MNTQLFPHWMYEIVLQKGGFEEDLSHAVIYSRGDDQKGITFHGALINKETNLLIVWA